MSEQMEQVGLGNTGPDLPPKCSKSRSWFFTFNNPSEENVGPEQMEQYLNMLEPKAWKFQLERGDEGTLHFQGVVYVKNPIVMPRHVCKKIHWERTKSWHAALKYVGKKETRVEGPWSYNVKEKVDLKVITELRPWQVMIKEMLDEEPDDRTINWFWEPDGQFGKTVLAKWICSNYNAIFLSGKASDAKCAVANYVKKNVLHAALFGFPKTAEGYVSYDALEQIKDGIFFNGKYESGMVMYNCPHVFVFCNFPPDESKMSRDRWNVVDLREWDR